jgi:hypothetical protein
MLSFLAIRVGVACARVGSPAGLRHPALQRHFLPHFIHFLQFLADQSGADIGFLRPFN